MNAVIYARYSSDNQREESIEGQLRECKEYADQNGITVVRTYIDRALSAKTDSRPQFQQMIHDSATHTFEAVLVWKLDRFSRNRYDSAHYKRILKNNRVHVVSVTEPISNTPEGIMLESLLEGMAEYYSAELAEKVSRGHKENALKAKFNGGPVGLSSLAVAVGEDASTLEDVHEPFLIMQGYISRTPRGRVAMPSAYLKMGAAPPANGQGWLL